MPPADQTTPPRSTKSVRRAFSSRVYRYYFGASCCSTFAVWISRFLLGWLTWDLTESAFWVGVVSAAMLLPTFLLSPFFGVISDRISARNGLLVTTSLQAAIAASVALADASGTLSVAWLLVVAVCVGAVSSAHHPMRLALLPQLVSRNLLPSAIGLSAVVFNSSRILAPAVAAWLVAQANAASAFGVAAALFVCTLLFLLAIRTEARQQSTERGSVLEDMRHGLRFIQQHPGIRLILTLTAINGLLGRSVIELLPAISGKLTEGGAGTLALLTAFAGVGSILGGLVLARQSGDEPRMLRLILLYMALGAVALFPLVVLTTVPALATIILLLSMTMTMIGTGCQTLIQLSVTDALRGRVLSIWTVVSMGMPAFGAFIMGALADVAGFGSVLVAFGLMALVATGLLSRRRHAFAGGDLAQDNA